MQGRPRSTLFPYTTLFRSAPPKEAAPREPSPREPSPNEPRPTPRRKAGGFSAAGKARASASSCASIAPFRSEEHTSELQSQSNLVCRLLLEKKKKTNTNT